MFSFLSKVRYWVRFTAILHFLTLTYFTDFSTFLKVH
nr:MAG TPA: hypothetical protein [Bacteriophage sp.]